MEDPPRSVGGKAAVATGVESRRPDRRGAASLHGLLEARNGSRVGAAP